MFEELKQAKGALKDLEQLVDGVPWTRTQWQKRRMVLYIALLFMGSHVSWMLVYAAYTNSENAIISTTIVTMLGVITTLIMTYVFGAVVDDNNSMKRNAELATLNATLAAPAPVATTTEEKTIKSTTTTVEKPVATAPASTTVSADTPPPGFAEGN